MEEKLEKYIKGELDLRPYINFAFLNRNYDFLKEIGTYIKNRYPSIIKTDDFNRDSEPDFLAIHFLSSSLNEKILEKMYEEGIKHSKFGEGFGKKKRKYQYISYFIDIEGHQFHIGYDHRGTQIECKHNISIKDLTKCLKSIVDRYYQTIIS